MKAMTTEKKKPMANITPFGLRMQPDLKARIEEGARITGRSLNAEIVHRLETYDAEVKRLSDMLLSERRELRLVRSLIETLQVERDASVKELQDFREEYSALLRQHNSLRDHIALMEVVADRLAKIDEFLHAHGMKG